jgi:hypothetical protein
LAGNRGFLDGSVRARGKELEENGFGVCLEKRGRGLTPLPLVS